MNAVTAIIIKHYSVLGAEISFYSGKLYIAGGAAWESTIHWRPEL